MVFPPHFRHLIIEILNTTLDAVLPVLKNGKRRCGSDLTTYTQVSNIFFKKKIELKESLGEAIVVKVNHPLSKELFPVEEFSSNLIFNNTFNLI